MNLACGVLVTLREIIGLDERQILQRRGLAVDDYVIHHLEGCKVDRAQVLRHVGPHVPLHDVHVGRQACDKNVGFGLGVDQVPYVARVHHIECTVAHDYFLLARPVANCIAHLLGCLDLV